MEPRNTVASELAYEAFTEALCHIQKKLGVTDGGFASHFWSGPREEMLLELLESYVEEEMENKEEDEMSDQFEAAAIDPKLVCAFSGKVHRPEEVGTFWSVADEEAYEQEGETVRIERLADQIANAMERHP